MRSFLRVFLLGFFLLAIGYFGACIGLKDNTSAAGQAFNKINILVKEEPRYVKIDNTKAVDEDGYGNYNYTLTSYDQKGQEHPIKFTGMGKLKQDHYLKLTTKGTYVITYQEAFEQNIPHNVYEKLNK